MRAILPKNNPKASFGHQAARTKGSRSPVPASYQPRVILLLDIGNTNTHLGLADGDRIWSQRNIPTSSWFNHSARKLIEEFRASVRLEGAALCSVVPKATHIAVGCVERHWAHVEVLNAETACGIGIDYPNPKTIGPDRLANAVAARAGFGSPSLVVDFGTAVTFDIINKKGDYIGGIIAPGLAAMTSYLHEKTALLPKIEVRDIDHVIGKNTEEAMLIGAVHGYAGLVKELITSVKRELKSRSLPVVATGGCAELIAKHVPLITEVRPLITLEGLRLFHAERLKITQ